MSLPPEWQIKHSKSRGGRVFYHNKLTNETRWDCPVSAVDDAEYPELNPSGDVKNVKNADHIKDNSANSLGQTPLNKRRRVDNKRNDDNVELSVQRGLSKVSGTHLVAKQSPCTRTTSKGKTKLKRNSAEKGKEQPKKSSGTKLYREASLRDLNAYLGGECVKEGKARRQRDSVPSGGSVSVCQTGPKSRVEKSGSNKPDRLDCGSVKKSEITASARLSDLKTYLEQCRGTQDKKTSPQSVKENCRTPKEDKTSKRGESFDVARKSGAVIAKTKDFKKAKKRDIKSTPYSRPEKSVLPKNYKIPKVVVKTDEKSNCTSQEQPQSRKALTDGRPRTESKPVETTTNKSADTTPLSGAATLKRKLETTDLSTTSHSSVPKDPPPTSLIGKIVSTSWNFLTRTLTSTAANTETQCEKDGGSATLFGDMTRGRGPQSTTSLQTPGKSSAEYSDEECEMMEIDEVVATISEIRNSLHNSQSESDSSFLEGRHETSTGSVHEPELPENAGKSSSAVQNFFVLDTNVLIHDLSFVEELVELSDREKLKVVIPWIVLQELDGLKSTSNASKAARKAIGYLLECRKSRRGGLVFEPNSGIRTEVADDRILLCLEWICDEDQDDSAAVLVSCDKNLRLKADVNGFESYDVCELRALLDTTTSTPGTPRRPKSASSPSTSSPTHISSSRALVVGRTSRSSPSRPPLSVNSFRDISTTQSNVRDVESREQTNMNLSRAGSRSPPPSPIDMRLAQFTGESSPKPELRSDIARFDKSVLQVLDEMSGSMTVFRQQVVTFVEAKLSTPGPGLTVQLTELQNFLSTLVPDVNKFLESCRAFNQVPVSQLKNNFSAVCDLVSAIQSYSVHHLHYAPNIAASDAYQWLIQPGHVDHVTATERHFSQLLSEMERAVDTLLTRKPFV